MKAFVKMRREKDGDYILDSSSHGQISLTYFFLCGDASINFDRTIAVLYKPHLSGYQSNFTYFEKDGNGNIILGTIHEDELGWGTIKCTDKQLEKLINDWKQILVEQPEYVTITQIDNGDFIVTSSNAVS